jgi:hypothetical protein
MMWMGRVVDEFERSKETNGRSRGSKCPSQDMNLTSQIQDRKVTVSAKLLVSVLC